MRRALAALLISSLLALLGIGNAAAADMRAVLTLRVNTVEKSDITVVIRGDDVLVTRGDLEDAGVRGLPLGNAKREDLISLASLRPALTYSIDDKALALDITVAVDHLAATSFDYHPQTELSFTKPARSAFLNYSVGLSSGAGANFSGEFGTRVGAGLLQSDATIAAHGGYDSHLTKWIVDSPQNDRRMTVGDIDISTGDLGAYATLDGIEVQRYFGMNPNVVQGVLPNIRGAVGSPSTADIYVNGTLIKQETLPPGEFSFQNLPVGLGPNNTQVVITDAFGRQQVLNSYFYSAQQLLAPGVTDFAYGAGVPRAAYGMAPATSGLTLAGQYRAGITPNLTAGGRLEASKSLLSGGGNAVIRLRGGVLGIETAASATGGATGAAAAISYQMMSRRVTIGTALLLQSAHYATLSQLPTGDRAFSQESLSVSAPTGRISTLVLSYNALHDRDNGAQSNWELTRWSTISSYATLSVSANLTQSPGSRSFGVSTAINFLPGNGMSANVTASDTGGQRQIAAGVAGSSTSGPTMLNYDAGVVSTQGASVNEYASAQYRWQYGEYLANVAAGAAGPAALSLQIAGGTVFIGHNVFATPPLSDSYALVDAGIPGVRVTANGRDAGRTNRAGYAIIPEIGSYFNNTVSFDPGDVPLNYAIDRSSRQIVPLYRSGAIVRFRMKQVLPVTGSLVVLVNGKPVVPAYGVVELQGEDLKTESDIGEQGEFYFENLSPGAYDAHIRFKGGDCKFRVTVPSTTLKFLKLGTLTCTGGTTS